MSRYRTLSAVFPTLLRRQDGVTEVLLHLRQNTGYMDGWWDMAGSGHVDEGETATATVVRECREELGIEVAQGDVEFAHLCHRLGLGGARTYYDLYFYVRRWQGEPRINEPDKSAELRWFALDKLPERMIALRREALAGMLAGRPYGESIVEPDDPAR